MNSNEIVYLKKKSGQEEPFDRAKLEESLVLTGVSRGIVDEVLNKILPKVKSGMTTNRVHNLAFNYLRKRSKVHAANYRVKRSIQELGPTGYPFEILCGELFKAKGFEIEIGVMVNGQFVKHEIDVIATRPDITIMAECKFHNSRSHKNDIKTALYVYGRSLDIKNNPESRRFDKFAIMTNTHFSADAIKYAEGVGMLLYSLNKDPNYSMISNLIRYKLYPISCLKSLKKKVISILFERKIVVVKQLEKEIEILKEFNMTDAEIKSVLLEIGKLKK